MKFNLSISLFVIIFLCKQQFLLNFFDSTNYFHQLVLVWEWFSMWHFKKAIGDSNHDNRSVNLAHFRDVIFFCLADVIENFGSNLFFSKVFIPFSYFLQIWSLINCGCFIGVLSGNVNLEESIQFIAEVGCKDIKWGDCWP